MSHLSTRIDTSNELVIHKHGNGIKLLPPCDKHFTNDLTIGNFLQMPFNVYFANIDSKIQTINEPSATTSGFDSSHNALGKSMIDVLEKPSAEAIIKGDLKIIQNKTIDIT